MGKGGAEVSFNRKPPVHDGPKARRRWEWRKQPGRGCSAESLLRSAFLEGGDGFNWKKRCILLAAVSREPTIRLIWHEPY